MSRESIAKEILERTQSSAQAARESVAAERSARDTREIERAASRYERALVDAARAKAELDAIGPSATARSQPPSSSARGDSMNEMFEEFSEAKGRAMQDRVIALMNGVPLTPTATSEKAAPETTAKPASANNIFEGDAAAFAAMQERSIAAVLHASSRR